MPELKPSLSELAVKAKRSIIMGVGGGGDVILGVPLANYLTLLGSEKIYLGGVSSQWWNPSGGSRLENFVLAPLVYDVAQLDNAELWQPMLSHVNPASTFDGNRPAEAAVSEVVPWDVIIGGLSNGVVGLRDSLNKFIADEGIDLFIGADIGAHSFHDGKETSPPFTSLVSMMTLSAMIQLDCPSLYAFAGYTVDAEMEIEELDERIGRIMQAGGFLGAYGITQKDVQDYLKACKAFPDPIEPLVARAAQGELGLVQVPVISPWGRRAHITPLAAIYLFLDPKIMVETVSTCVKALMDTKSIAEAETIYYEVVGLFPETWTPRVINYVGKRGSDYLHQG
jgi:hypothetical protein